MILADTTFLVDLLRKNSSARTFIDQNRDVGFCTTEINAFELFLGIFSSKRLFSQPELLISKQKEVNLFLDRFTALPVKREGAIEAARELGRLRREGQTVEIRDALVFGVMKSHKIQGVVTRNVHHFQRFTGISVLEY